MSDDFRLQVELDASGDGFSFAESMRELSLQRDARKQLGDRVAVSADGPHVFVYTDTEDAARAALQAIQPLLKEHNLTDSSVSLTRWHPEEERWEPIDKPLPSTPAEHAAEHATEEADEDAQTAEQGFAEWEVRVELPSHHETVQFAKQLESEGFPVLRRWKFLLIGAPDEDLANQVAERVKAEAPEGTKVHAELSGAVVWQVGDPYPFAVFGGLGG